MFSFLFGCSEYPNVFKLIPMYVLMLLSLLFCSQQSLYFQFPQEFVYSVQLKRDRLYTH